MIIAYLNYDEIEKFIESSYWVYKKIQSLGYGCDSVIGDVNFYVDAEEFALPRRRQDRFYFAYINEDAVDMLLNNGDSLSKLRRLHVQISTDDDFYEPDSKASAIMVQKFVELAKQFPVVSDLEVLNTHGDRIKECIFLDQKKADCQFTLLDKVLKTAKFNINHISDCLDETLLSSMIAKKCPLEKITQFMARFVAMKADINMKKYEGKSALHFAAYKSDDHVMNLLLDNGADINLRCNFGATPLFQAVRGNEPNNIRLLIAKGAEYKTIVDEAGTGPLHYAAMHTTSLTATALL